MIRALALIGAVCLQACSSTSLQSAATKAAHAREMLCDDRWMDLGQLLAPPRAQR